MIVAAVSIAFVLIILVVTPFFSKDASILSPGSSVNDPDLLKSLKDNLIKRYIEEEVAHRKGHLSNVAWNKRRQYLVNRYVDAARRLDFLERLAG